MDAPTPRLAGDYAPVLPDVAGAALVVLEPRGYRLEHDQLAETLNAVHPDGTVIALDRLLGPDSPADWDEALTAVAERAVLAGGSTRTQRGRYRRPGVQTSATLPQAMRRLYRDQREEIERRLARSEDLALLRLAGHCGSYARALLHNPKAPRDVVARIGDAFRRHDERVFSTREMLREDNIEDLLCAHPALDERQIRQLYRRRWGLNAKLANHPLLPHDLQRLYFETALSGPGHIWLLRGLADNPALLPELATGIWDVVRAPNAASVPDYRVRNGLDDNREGLLKSLAGNAATPPEILERLALADEPELDRALLANPRLDMLPAPIAERVRIEGREDVVAAVGAQVLYGQLDQLDRHAHAERIVVYDQDGRFHVDAWPDGDFELRGGVSVPLPPELSRDLEPRLLQGPRYANDGDTRTVRQRARLLLHDWPQAYERALSARRERAEQIVGDARSRYETQLEREHQELLKRLALAVADGLEPEVAVNLGGVSRQELDEAQRRYSPSTPDLSGFDH